MHHHWQLESNRGDAAQLRTKQSTEDPCDADVVPVVTHFPTLPLLLTVFIHSFHLSLFSFSVSQFLFFSPLQCFAVTLVCLSLVSPCLPVSLPVPPPTPVSLCQWELWGVTVPLRCALLPLYLHLSVSLKYTITHFHLSWPLLFLWLPLFPLHINGVCPKAPSLPPNKPVNSVWHLSGCYRQSQPDKWSAVHFPALSLSATPRPLLLFLAHTHRHTFTHLKLALMYRQTHLLYTHTLT